MRKTSIGFAAVLAVVGIAALLASALRPHGASARAHSPTLAAKARLDLAHLASLRSASTRIPDVPAAARVIGSAYTPVPGEVHRLGRAGVDLAWVHDGQVCEVQENAGGCVPPQDVPIEVTIADADIVGEGAPLRVVGLATDDVSAVTVKLTDGRAVTSRPVNNFYLVQLVADTRPYDIASVEATMKDGSHYAAHLPG